nr:hypothetical protein TorRG33x02_228910 [Ipomoea batatas]
MITTSSFRMKLEAFMARRKGVPGRSMGMEISPEAMALNGSANRATWAGSSTLMKSRQASQKGLRLEEIGQHLPHPDGFLLGRGLRGRRENLVHRLRPPRLHQLVLVGEEELVAGGPAEDGRLFSQEVCSKHGGRVLGHPIKNELFRLALPPGGEKRQALSDERPSGLAGRKLSQILDDESTCRAGSVVAADEEPQDLVGDFQLRHELPVFVGGEEHLLSYEVGGFYGSPERRSGEIYGDGNEPRGNGVEWLGEPGYVSRVLHADEEPAG